MSKLLMVEHLYCPIHEVELILEPPPCYSFLNWDLRSFITFEKNRYEHLRWVSGSPQVFKWAGDVLKCEGRPARGGHALCHLFYCICIALQLLRGRKLGDPLTKRSPSDHATWLQDGQAVVAESILLSDFLPESLFARSWSRMYWLSMDPCFWQQSLLGLSQIHD